MDRLGYLLSLTHEESYGFIDHTEYEQDAIYGKINYELSETSRVNFAYSYDEGSNGDPVLNWPDFWDDIDRKRTYQRLLFETSPSDSLDLTVEGRHQRFSNWIDDVYPDHREEYFDYSEETWGGSARLSYKVPEANRLNLGFDGDWGRYDFSPYSKEYDTGNWAMYANDTLNLRHTRATGKMNNPLVQPFRQEDVSGLPPTYLMTAGFDPRRDDNKDYADRLAAAGVPTTFRCIDETIHGFMFMLGGIDRAVEAAKESSTYLKKEFAANLALGKT